MATESNRLIKEKGQRLQYVRELARFNRKDIAKIVNTSFYTYKGWEVGKHDGLIEPLARKLISILNTEGVDCSFEWLMHGIGDKPKKVRGYLAESEESHKHKTSKTKQTDEQQIIDEELKLFCKNCTNPLYLIITDDAMEPNFLPADIVAGEILPKRDYKKILGTPCIIQLKTGQLLLRLLQNGTEKNRYTLTCINPNTKSAFALTNVEIANLTSVLWYRRKKLKR